MLVVCCTAPRTPQGGCAWDLHAPHNLPAPGGSLRVRLSYSVASSPPAPAPFAWSFISEIPSIRVKICLWYDDGLEHCLAF